jgi:hypothetical protein
LNLHEEAVFIHSEEVIIDIVSVHLYFLLEEGAFIFMFIQALRPKQKPEFLNFNTRFSPRFNHS